MLYNTLIPIKLIMAILKLRIFIVISKGTARLLMKVEEKILF